MVLLRGGGPNLEEAVTECLLPAHLDMTVVCRGGSTGASSLLLRLVSPFLSSALGPSPSLLLLPDVPLSSLQLLLASLPSPSPPSPFLLPTLTTLGAFLPSPRPPAPPSPLPSFPLQPFFKEIPELPDIQSTELFAPEYLEEEVDIEECEEDVEYLEEEVEIEEEEDLSLTIHSCEPDTGAEAGPGRRRGRRRAAARVRRGGRGEEGEGGQEGSQLVCNVCSHSTETEEELKVHIRLQHKSGRRAHHLCTCGKTFKKQFQLANHQRVHTGDKPFVCHTCGKAFNQEATLRTHMRIHSGARPFKCDHCSEAFNATSALAAHKQWKHADGSRPFLCSFCSKSFPTKAAVRKHETIHKPAERRHPCTECDKRFARADHLKSHMRAHKLPLPS